ncbi:cation transporter [Brevundimonas lutea]|uniref:cation transporter n=1 Tax=Brevundimonas lutea TaxID=2293980 RepID=UPI000F0182F6|nr:cation transporter [Brevundimonas lutea]
MAETSPPSAVASGGPSSMGPGLRLGLVIAVLAFGLAASGSVSVFALLVCTALDLLAWTGAMAAGRWSAGDMRRGARARAVAGVFQSGLGFAAAAFLGWEALGRIFSPRPLIVGEWGVIAVLLALAAATVAIFLTRRRVRSDAQPPLHETLATELAPSLVALIGAASATWLAAPGLDGAAALVIAVWLAWGAFSLLRGALATLVEPGRASDDTAGPWTSVNGG